MDFVRPIARGKLAVTPYGREGNRRFGIALATCHRVLWFVGSAPKKPSYTPLWSMATSACSFLRVCLQMLYTCTHAHWIDCRFPGNWGYVDWLPLPR